MIKIHLIYFIMFMFVWFSCDNSTEPDNTFVPEEFMEGTWNLISVIDGK